MSATRNHAAFLPAMLILAPTLVQTFSPATAVAQNVLEEVIVNGARLMI